MPDTIKLKNHSYYAKWKRLLELRWKKDSRKWEIYQGEIDKENLEAHEGLHHNTVAADVRSEEQMISDIISNVSRKYADPILEMDRFSEIWSY